MASYNAAISRKDFKAAKGAVRQDMETSRTIRAANLSRFHGIDKQMQPVAECRRHSRKRSRLILGWQGTFGDQRSAPEVDEDQHWMWVARVLGRSDEYKRRRTCRKGKAVNSKKLPPVPPTESWPRACYWLRLYIKSLARPAPTVSPSKPSEKWDCFWFVN